MEFFQYIHRTQLLLVEARLILVCDQEHLIFVLIEFLWQFFLRKPIHTYFRIFLAIYGDLPGKRDQCFQPRIALALDIVFKSLPVFDGPCARLCDHHSFRLPIQLLHDILPEMLDDHLDALRNIRLMQLHEASDLTLGIIRFQLRIVFDLFIETIEGIVGDVILQHIKNESFLDRLFHRVHMKGFILALGIHSAKKLQRRRFWRSRESKDGNIGLFPMVADLVSDHILRIRIRIRLTRAQRSCDGCHIFPCRRGMRFIDDHSKALVP